MKKILLLTLLITSGLLASLRVDTTYSTLGAVTQQIGGDLVKVTVLGSSKYDPHFIVPKPSLIAKLNRADLLIMNGGGLELGWLPPLIKNANNAAVQPGAKGFLDMSHFITFIDKPASVSRGFGDIHAEGNPHYSLDPHMVLTMAKVIANKLSSLDPENAQKYKSNLDLFLNKWNAYLKDYDSKMSMCKNKNVVQYHELYNYYFKRYSFNNYGNIEPLPGISPSSKHTVQLINTMKKNSVTIILQDVYHEKRTANFIADKTDAKVVVIPHDVGSVKGTETLEDFYSMIAKRLCQ
ncbi:MAG: zinc/manganese transport system substrate-binding protein [Sulfurimonas sp.]|jgi:zinc/manganese transport system substrate-binding protein